MKKRQLMKLAGILWMFAGVMVSNIGIKAYSNLGSSALIYLPGNFIIFSLFFFKNFSPLVDKNRERIFSLDQNQVKIWRFLDKKSYLIMAGMMTYGIYDVIGKGQETISIGAISGFSGIGHLLLGVGLVWTWVKIQKAISLEKSVQA